MFPDDLSVLKLHPHERISERNPDFPGQFAKIISTTETETPEYLSLTSSPLIL